MLTFIIRDFPDLDHSFPVIHYFLKKKENVNILNFEINLDLKSDLRISFLSNSYNKLRIYEAYSIKGDRFLIDKILNFISQAKYKNVNFTNFYTIIKEKKNFNIFFLLLICFFKKIIFSADIFYESFIFNKRWAENIIKKINISSLVVDDSFYLNYKRAQSLFLLLKNLNVKITLIPHTCSIFFRDEDIECLKSRNFKSFYPNMIVTSNKIKETFVNFGMPKQKIMSLGSARFSKDNLKTLDVIYKNNNVINNTKLTNKLKILYIDGAYDNSNEKLNLLNNILKLNSIILTIKAHPRGNFGNNITSSLKKRFKLESNLNFNIDASTMTKKLIQDNDIILGTYSSTLIDAILLNKKIVLPKFLVKNFNIFFEDRKFVFVCHNVNEVILLLKKLSKVNFIKVSNKVKNDKNDFLRKYVYGDCIDSSKILKSYYNLIK
jgi:hypothetical protein